MNETRSIEARGFNQPSGDDRWISIQKKTFTNWVNEQLKSSGNKVSDLATDFSDGYKLVILMEALTSEDGCQWKKVLGPFSNRKPNKTQLRVHQMETVEFALNIMKFEKLDLTNIGASDIVDQNLKLILGVVWKLILKFQIGSSGRGPQGKTKRNLLDLVNTLLPDLGGVKNFSSDWNSGVALSALCNYCDPSMFPDWREMNDSDKLSNCRQAIQQAQSRLKVPQLITPEDMASSELDDQSGMTYISYFLADDGPVSASLLKWVQTKIPDQRVKNFGSDWRTGITLCALNNAVFPGSCPDYQSMDARDKVNNSQKAIALCSKNGIESVLIAQELSADEPSTVAIMNQVAKFQHVKPPQTKSGGRDRDSNPLPQQQSRPHLTHQNELANGGVEEEPLVKVRQAAANQNSALQSAPPPRQFSNNYSFSPSNSGGGMIHSGNTSNNNNNYQQVDKPTPSHAFTSPPPKEFSSSFDEPDNEVSSMNTQDNNLYSGNKSPIMSHRNTGRQVSNANSYSTKKFVSAINSPGSLVSPGVPQQFADNEREMDKSSNSYTSQLNSATLELDSRTTGGYRSPKGNCPAVFIGDMVKFNLSLPARTDLKDIAISVDSPSGTKQQSPVDNITRQGANKAVVSVSPNETGDHFVICSIRNKPVRGTPFEMFVLPTKDQIILQQSESATVVNTRVEYVVDCGCSVGDMISFRCVGPDNNPLNCTQQHNNATNSALQKFSFTPKLLGHYNISALFNGENVMNSPSLHTVFNPNKVHISGIKDVNVGQTITIALDLREAGPGEPEVNIVQNVMQQKVSLKSGPQMGQYIGMFKTANTGPHLAYVYLHNALVNGRPIEFNVGSGGALIKCYGMGLQKGVEDVESSFTVDASKAYKQLDNLQVTVEGANSLAKCSVQRNDNNTFTATYRPVEVGFYEVSVHADGEAVTGSPYKVKVINPRKVKCTQLYESFMDSDGQVKLELNKRFSLSFDTSNAGPGDFGAKVSGPSGNLVPCSLEKDKLLSLHTVNFMPKSRGRYEINLTLDELPIPRSPLIGVTRDNSVKNIGEITCSGRGLENPRVKEETMFTIDTSQALVPGEPEVRMSGLHGDVKVEVSKKSDTIYHATYNPYMQGMYLMHVTYADRQVPGSPFKVIVQPSVNSQSVEAFGPGLKEGVIGRPIKFGVDTRAARPGEPEVRMSGLHGDVKVEVSKKSDTIYHATYNPYMQGMYLMHVTYADRQVPGSPFKVIVQPSVNSQSVEAFGPGLKEGVIGRPIKFGVDTRAARPGLLTFDCRGPRGTQATVDVIDNLDGTYSMNIMPKEAGKHGLEIKYDSEHIHNSPYLVRISGAPDPTKCRIYGPGLEHGVLSSFRGDFVCDTKGAGAGQLKVRVHGPKGGFKVDMHRDTSKDRTIVVRYNPTEPGDYKVEVWWADVEIPQSPFEVKIFQDVQELEEFLLENPQERNKYPPVNGSVSSTQSFSLLNGSSLDSEKYWKADV